MERKELTSAIKDKARSLGFELVGVSPAGSYPEAQMYKEWLSRGYAGNMAYMEREPERRGDVRRVLPNAESIITCGLNYNTDKPYSTEMEDSARGWIARYAWGDDYHTVMDEKLQALADFIRDESPSRASVLKYSDTGPVLERAYGKYGGVGWIGKNTCLINQGIGSWIFIGELITDIELEYDNPAPERCGTCTRCIDACPTGAITKPYVLDSRLCISYLTIELKDSIPPALRDKMGNNVFGCDICQDVCPWNKRAPATSEPGFRPRDGVFSPELDVLALMSPEDFRALFKGSPVKRAKRRGLIRNALVAIGNSGDSGFVPLLKECAYDGEALVRAHALWALWKIEGPAALDTIMSVKKDETDPAVLEEIDYLLQAAAADPLLEAGGRL